MSIPMRLQQFFRNERGSALALVLAFLVLAVPLTTAALAFTATHLRQGQAQTDLTYGQYATGSVKDYAIQKLLSANDEGSTAVQDLLSEPEDLTLNGRQYTIDWSHASDPEDEPESDPIVFQTSKEVSPATAPENQVTPVTYTMEVHNTSPDQQTLERILDSLPSGFTYVTGSAVFEGAAWADPVKTEFNPPQGSAGRVELLEWEMDGVEVVSGEHVTLEFQAETYSEIPEGAYCNIAWVDPGGHATGTPPGSAKLLVGDDPVTECADELLHVTKEVCVATDGACEPRPEVTVPYNVQNTYAYTIEAENQWDQTMYLCFLFDILPAGLTWNGIYTSEVGTQSVFQDDVDNQQVNFRFHPNCADGSRVIGADHTRTFTLQGQGSLGFGENGNGVHQNAVRLMVALGNADGPIAWAFSGLTADIIVYNVYWITIHDAKAGTTIRAEVWINADGSHDVGPWRTITP